jgi:hypothetical protein
VEKACIICGLIADAELFKPRRNICKKCWPAFQAKYLKKYREEHKKETKRDKYRLLNHDCEQKTCSTCNILKNITDFPRSDIKNNKVYYRSKCKACTSKNHCERYCTKNKLLYTCKTKICNGCKIEKEASIKFFCLRKGKYGFYFNGKCKECVKKTKDNYKPILNLKTTERRKNDHFFKLRTYVSSCIGFVLSKNKSSKKGESVMKYLPYTIEELSKYLESLFLPWMTWDNRGVYNVEKWDDNNSCTWTWQLDHIIPQSKLPYYSMEDENFKKAWALSNLRPYSAKQNILDGNRR